MDGSLPHWVYATAPHPWVRGDADYRHQFAIFGSYPDKKPPIEKPPFNTFLQQFLELSKF